MILLHNGSPYCANAKMGDSYAWNSPNIDRIHYHIIKKNALAAVLLIYINKSDYLLSNFLRLCSLIFSKCVLKLFSICCTWLVLCSSSSDDTSHSGTS